MPEFYSARRPSGEWREGRTEWWAKQGLAQRGQDIAKQQAEEQLEDIRLGRKESRDEAAIERAAARERFLKGLGFEEDKFEEGKYQFGKTFGLSKEESEEMRRLARGKFGLEGERFDEDKRARKEAETLARKKFKLDRILGKGAADLAEKEFEEGKTRFTETGARVDRGLDIQKSGMEKPSAQVEFEEYRRKQLGEQEWKDLITGKYERGQQQTASEIDFYSAQLAKAEAEGNIEQTQAYRKLINATAKRAGIPLPEAPPQDTGPSPSAIIDLPDEVRTALKRAGSPIDTISLLWQNDYKALNEGQKNTIAKYLRSSLGDEALQDMADRTAEENFPVMGSATAERMLSGPIGVHGGGLLGGSLARKTIGPIARGIATGYLGHAARALDKGEAQDMQLVLEDIIYRSGIRQPALDNSQGF